MRTFNDRLIPRDRQMPVRRSILIGITILGARHYLGVAALAADSRNINDEFLQQAMAITGLSVLASRWALPRLTVPKLKRFADLEVAEQETAWSVLKSLKGDRSSEEKTEIPADAELEDYLVPLGRTVLTNLRHTDDGTNSARDYFLLEVNIHQQLLRLHEDYLKLAPAARWLAPVKLMDVATREHLGLLNEIKADTDSGKGAARPGR
jgi:putative membrane protein